MLLLSANTWPGVVQLKADPSAINLKVSGVESYFDYSVSRGCEGVGRSVLLLHVYALLHFLWYCEHRLL